MGRGPKFFFVFKIYFIKFCASIFFFLKIVLSSKVVSVLPFCASLFYVPAENSVTVKENYLYRPHWKSVALSLRFRSPKFKTCRCRKNKADLDVRDGKCSSVHVNLTREYFLSSHPFSHLPLADSWGLDLMQN